MPIGKANKDPNAKPQKAIPVTGTRKGSAAKSKPRT